MKHKESFNATLAIGFILILAAWVTFRMWELPEIFKFANTIHIIVILGCFGIISWNILKLDYRNKYMDRMTGINNDAWIVRQGAILYYRNKLNGYDVIFLNVKDCKYINQKVTNQNGDIVLAEYANRLKAFLKKKGYIGRMGGDNFLVFIKDEYLDDFLKFIKTIYVEIEAKGEHHRIHVKARAGIEKVQNEVAYRDVINFCSSALVMAKNEKKDFVIFKDEMYQQHINNMKILAEYKIGIKNKEFIPFYQPKVDARTGKLCGAEALVRWNKSGKIISPFFFVPVLEQEGEITNLDFYVFEYVCSDLRKWIDAGLEPVKISSNFSKLNLRDEDFAKRIIGIKDKYNIDSKLIEIELTESTGSDDLDALKAFSRKIKEAGIGIAIDDFGTGYSSLSLLRNFDADVIKLDKSFLDSASDNDPASKTFIKDIIHMIDNQNETILCEGVENKSQLDFLKESGCHIIQGYFFDKPLEKAEFEKRMINPIYV